MKVLLFGASGMVGQGVLRACLGDPAVTEVVVAGRAPLALEHAKLTQMHFTASADLDRHAPQLADVDAAFFCIGSSSSGATEAAYRAINYALPVDVATRLATLRPAMTFVYVSGAGADSSEQGRSMWARVRGATENAVLALPFRQAFALRPAVIQPLHGARSKTSAYRWFYLLAAPFFPLLRWLAPGQVLDTALVGQAMLLLARQGAAKRVLESADIRALAGGPS